MYLQRAVINLGPQNKNIQCVRVECESLKPDDNSFILQKQYLKYSKFELNYNNYDRNYKNYIRNYWFLFVIESYQFIRLFNVFNVFNVLNVLNVLKMRD